jgi:hypothetical protein
MQICLIDIDSLKIKKKTTGRLQELLDLVNLQSQ